MADEKKRLTATELRKEQEGRERLATEAAQREQARVQEEQAARAREATRALVDSVKATWYDNVVKASQQPGIRFLVLAQVVGMEGRNYPPVDEIRAEIHTAEYTTDIIRIGESIDVKEGQVSDGKFKGWKPAKIPIFGLNGEIRWLIVRW
jgi:hypothetical protein